MLKINWNKEYTSITVYACIVSALTVAVIFIAINLGKINAVFGNFVSIASPVIYGFATAYLLNPIMKFCESKVFGFIGRVKPRRVLKRALSLILTYMLLAVTLTLFVSLIVPHIVESYEELTSKMNSYVSSAKDWVNKLIDSSGLLNSQFAGLPLNIDMDAIAEKINGLISGSYDIFRDISPYLLNMFKAVVDQLKNVFLGLIFSIYFLASKEKLAAQSKKILYAFLSENKAGKTIEALKHTDRTFGGFIIGKMLDSLLVGVMVFTAMAIIGMPHYQLISLLVGVTDLIPFFGPFIGAIPSAFIIFITDPIMAFWFLVLILVVQQIDGNFVAPKILGDSTGLSSLWVIVAITVMSGIFGVVGMFVGVPMFAVIYYFVKRIIERILTLKKLPVDTASYIGNRSDNGGGGNEI